MKKKVFKLLGFAFVLVFALVLLTSCNDDNINSSTDASDYYCTSQTLDWNETGKYQGQITLPDGSKETFNNVSADDFEFVASINSGNPEEPVTMNLKSFSVSKVDDTTIKYEFTSPLSDNFDVSYVLASTKSVVSDNKVVSVFLSICEPDIFLTGEAIGAYAGSNSLVLNVEFGDMGKFVSELTPSMFTFAEKLNSYVKVERISDKKAKITVENMPTDLNVGSIDVVVSKYAIDSKFAKDITLNIDYSNPQISVDYDTVSYDEATSTVTIGKVYVKGGTGTKGSIFSTGIDILNTEIVEYAQVLSQDYNETENYYSVSLKVNTNVKDVLQKITLSCDINLIYETITYPFSISLDDPYIDVNVADPDFDTNTVAITLNISNGNFKDDLSVDDLGIDGNDLLSNFEIINASEKQITLSASFPEETSLCEILFFNINNDILKNPFTDADCTGIADVIVIYGDRYDWGKFALRVSKNSIGLIKNPVLSKVVLPELFNFFELDASDNKNKKVEQQIKELRAAVEDLSNDIINLKDYVTVSEFRSFIENIYTPLDSKLSLVLKSYMGKADIVEYIQEISKYLNLDEYKKGQEDYAKYYNYLEEVGLDFDQFTEEQLKQYYKLFQFKAKDYSYDKFYVYYVNIFSGHCGYNMYELKERFVNMHNFFQTANPLVDINEQEIDASLKSKFINATEATLSNLGVTDYIANIKLYGDYIISSNIGHGISTSVIEKYFSVCDGIYNFESQTIQHKKSFLAKLQYTYLFNAAFAKQIMYEKGEDAIADELGKQMVEVQNCLDQYWKVIDEMEARQKAGKDRILVCAPEVYVSKSMVVINTEDYHGRHMREKGTRQYVINLKQMGSNVVKISAENILEMCNRAKARNVTLAEDLINAGFKNVQKDSKDNTGTKYTYLTAPVTPEYSYVSDFKAGLNVFGELFAYMKKGHKYYEGTIVTQSTSLDAKKIKNCTICDNVEYESCSKGYVKFSSSYTYLIGFQK